MAIARMSNSPKIGTPLFCCKNRIIYDITIRMRNTVYPQDHQMVQAERQLPEKGRRYLQFDERIIANRLFCDAEIHPGDACFLD